MSMISTRAHGIIDYIVGIALIAAPWLLGFANSGYATWVPVSVGAALLLSSLITKYDYSLAKIIPMPAHLMLDMAMGAFLIASPWLFGFASLVYLPHVIVGVAEIAIATMTVRQPFEGEIRGKADLRHV